MSDARPQLPIIVLALVAGFAVGRTFVARQPVETSAQLPRTKAECTVLASERPTRDGMLVMLDFCNDYFPVAQPASAPAVLGEPTLRRGNRPPDPPPGFTLDPPR